MKAKSMDLQNACYCANVATRSSMIDVVEYSLKRFGAQTTSDVSNNKQMQNDSEMSEVHMKYNRLVAQLKKVILEGKNLWLLVSERGDEIICLGPSLHSSIDEYKQIEVQIEIV